MCGHASIFLKNRFIEIWFICHTIYPYRVYTSMEYSIFTESCTITSIENSRTFPSPQKETPDSLAIIPSNPFLLPQTTTNLHPVYRFTYSGHSHKQNHTICGLLWQRVFVLIIVKIGKYSGQGRKWRNHSFWTLCVSMLFCHLTSQAALAVCPSTWDSWTAWWWQHCRHDCSTKKRMGKASRLDFAPQE